MRRTRRSKGGNGRARLGALIVLAVLWAGVGPAFAQQTVPPQDEATTVEDIVVTGRRTEDAVRDFIGEAAAPASGRGPARWNRRVCVGVAGMRNDVAQSLVDHISGVALRIGLEPDDPGCVANILVVATDDGQAMARALVRASPRAFRPGYGGAARSSEALSAFQDTDDAVRWWHVSLPVDSESGQPAVRIRGFDPPVIQTFAASRLKTQVRNDLQRVIIVWDVERSGDAPLEAVADYMAMVALAQLDPEARTDSFDTVLNLFTPGVGAEGLTDWDRSYLNALYGAELNAVSARQQEGELASMMTREQIEARREREDAEPAGPITP